MSRGKGLFITGTDTGVGKTRVTAVLAIALQRQGFHIGVMKPVETGCLIGSAPGSAQGPHPTSPLPTTSTDDLPSCDGIGDKACGMEWSRRGRGSGEGGMGPCADPVSPSVRQGVSVAIDVETSLSFLHAEDSQFLRQISGCTAPAEIVTPYMFREPLAPAIAAEHEGREIELDHIVDCYEMLAAEYDIVLVEGAGGLLVPLTRQQNFLDLAARLNLPILVVARNILGTINHTALTVMAASQRCRVSGIVLNTVTEEAQDVSQASNAEALRIWGRAPLLGVLPYMLEITPESLFKQSKNIDLSAILSSALPQ